MADTSNLSNYLKDVADAIRDKKGTEEQIPAANFDTEIRNIQTGIDTSDATAISDDIINPKTAYVNGKKIEGTLTDYNAGLNTGVESITPNTGYDGSYIEFKAPEQDGPFAFSSNKVSLIMTPQMSQVAEGIGLTPEKLVKGNTILGVEGTAEASVGTKLFETQEEMQADSTAKEGDLAIVYRSEIQNMTADTQTQYITFPETVVLPEAFTGDIFCMLRAIDETVMFDGQVMLNQSMFDFNGYTSTDMIRVEYSSADGIIYNRTRFTGDSGDLTNPVDFGTVIGVYFSEAWNDNIGYFMQVGGNIFEGLFKYSSYTDSDIYLPDYSTLSYTNSISIEISENILSLDRIKSIMNSLDKKDYVDYDIAYDGTYYYILPYIQDIQGASLTYGYYDTANNKMYFTIGAIAQGSPAIETPSVVYVVNNDFEISNTIDISTLNEVIFMFGATPSNYYKIAEITLNDKTMILHIRNDHAGIYFYNNIFRYASGTGSNVTSSNYYSFTDTHPLKYMYTLAPSQLTAIKDNVYNLTYYGKDGVNEGILQNTTGLSKEQVNFRIQIWNKYGKDNAIVAPEDCSDMLSYPSVTAVPLIEAIPLIDTSNTINMDSMFARNNKLETIPSLNTSKVTNMASMFNECVSLTNIPQLDTSKVTNMASMFNECVSLTNIPQLDTSNVTDMRSMFRSCRNLTTVPLSDTSKVTNMYYTFYGCTNLTTMPLLDTSKVTDMRGTFYGCTNLQSVPLLNTSKVTNIDSMFKNCTSLSDESLNNIMQMCINATSYTGTKTLNRIGLSEAQAQTCTTLSNYSAFTAAGWTTGY